MPSRKQRITAAIKRLNALSDELLKLWQTEKEAKAARLLHQAAIDTAQTVGQLETLAPTHRRWGK